MHRLILFASGRGSNAAAIIDHFRHQEDVSVKLIVTNKADAGVIDIAQREEIPVQVIGREMLQGDALTGLLDPLHPSLIVLAGFLWKIPDGLIRRYRGRIVNIHPALLPAYGGKGMYGAHVHQAVLGSGDAQSGITIHQVDEIYDHGQVLLQARCPVTAGDTVESLATRVHRLEHYYFPRTIEFLLRQPEGA